MVMTAWIKIEVILLLLLGEREEKRDRYATISTTLLKVICHNRRGLVVTWPTLSPTTTQPHQLHNPNAKDKLSPHSITAADPTLTRSNVGFISWLAMPCDTRRRIFLAIANGQEERVWWDVWSIQVITREVATEKRL
jgi:hypothetical protein